MLFQKVEMMGDIEYKVEMIDIIKIETNVFGKYIFMDSFFKNLSIKKDMITSEEIISKIIILKNSKFQLISGENLNQK